MRIKRKVYTYITHEEQLLIFEHVRHPDAGIQVPGGTLEPGEDPAAGALREAREETGLAALRLLEMLGTTWHDLRAYGLDGLHERYYFHLICTAPPPAVWTHWERHASDGSDPIEFRFRWAALPDSVPPLIGGLDEMLGTLNARLGL